MRDRLSQLAERLDDIGRADRATRRRAGSRTMRKIGIAKIANRTPRARKVSSGPADQSDEDRAADEDRPHVADGHADPGQLAARRGHADDRERRVVVDERRLVGEVRDDEQDDADDRWREPDQDRRHDAQDREHEQERQPPTAAVAERAEDRRHERVEADADRRWRCRWTSCPLASTEPARVRQPVQPDRHRHDGEAEDRVGEVVQRPGGRDDRAATRRQAGKAAGAGRRTEGRGARGHAPMIRGAIRRCPTTMTAQWPPTTPSSSRETSQLQWFGRAASDRIREPVVEPLWSGLRVIAAAQDGKAAPAGRRRGGRRATSTSPRPSPRPWRPPRPASILDGYVTKQVANDEPGVYTGAVRPAVDREHADRQPVGGAAAQARSSSPRSSTRSWLSSTSTRTSRSTSSSSTCSGSTGSGCSTSRCSSASASSRPSSPATRWSAPASTSARRSSAGSARGAPRASAASRSRARTRAIDRARSPATGPRGPCPAR